MQKQQHVNLSVREIGFHVQVDYPFLGASPDGIVSCDCHDQKLLKIKCPCKYEDGFLNWENDRCPFSKRPFVENFKSVLLSSTVTFSSVDFLIYSPKNNGSNLLTTVKSNKDFIEKMDAKSW